MAERKKTLQRYIELLEVCNIPSVTTAIVKSAPESVIKTICNAALNCYRGEVILNPRQKKILRKFRGKIEKLCSKNIGLKTKRRILVQKGGAIWIPLLVGALLHNFGSALLDKIK